MLISATAMLLTAATPVAEPAVTIDVSLAQSQPFVRPPPDPETAQSPSYRRFEKQPETRGYMVIVPTPPQAHLQAAQGKPKWLEPNGGWRSTAIKRSPTRSFRLLPRKH